MRAITSFIKEMLLEGDEPETSDDGERSWESITSSVESFSAWLDDNLGRAKAEIDQAKSSADKSADEITSEFESYVQRGMSSEDWQAFASEEAILTPEKREQIRKDVDDEFALLFSEAGVVISDNDVVNFRYSIRNLLEKDLADDSINYPYRTAFYIIAYDKGIYTFGDAFSNIMGNTASLISLPFAAAGLALDEPAGGDPAEDAGLSNTEVVVYALGGTALSVPLAKFLSNLLGHAVLETGVKKALKLLPGDFFNSISRSRIQAALQNEAEWKEMTKRISSESLIRSEKKGIADVYNAWLRAYKDGISYGNFIEELTRFRSNVQPFTDAGGKEITVTVKSSQVAGSQTVNLGNATFNTSVLDGLNSVEEFEEFAFEIARRFIYRALENKDIQKASKGSIGSAKEFFTGVTFRDLLEDSKFNAVDPKFLDFADFLDSFRAGSDSDLGDKIANRLIRAVSSDPDAVRFDPFEAGKTLPNKFTIQTSGSGIDDAKKLSDGVKRCIDNIMKLSEDLAEPATTLTMLGKIFKGGRTIIAGKYGLLTGLKGSLALAGLGEFANILAGDDESTTLLQASIIATGAVIRRDAYDAFVSIREQEPDINIMGISKNVGISARIEGKFKKADKELSNLLKRPVGDPDNDAGQVDMAQIRDLYDEALKGTVQSALETAGWIGGAAAGARTGSAITKILPPAMGARFRAPIIAGSTVLGSILGPAAVRYAEELDAGTIDVPEQPERKGAVKESIDLKLLRNLIRSIL